MAFKDKFDKLISYFDTDEVSDVEETVEDEVRQPRVQQQVEAKPQQAPRRAEQQFSSARAQQAQACWRGCSSTCATSTKTCS